MALPSPRDPFHSSPFHSPPVSQYPSPPTPHSTSSPNPMPPLDALSPGASPISLAYSISMDNDACLTSLCPTLEMPGDADTCRSAPQRPPPSPTARSPAPPRSHCPLGSRTSNAIHSKQFSTPDAGPTSPASPSPYSPYSLYSPYSFISRSDRRDEAASDSNSGAAMRLGHNRSQSESAAGGRSHFTEHMFFPDYSDVNLRYRLGTFLGSGMMGFVRRCIEVGDAGEEREWACKTVSKAKLHTHEQAQLLVNEVHVMRNVGRHNVLLQLRDVIEDEYVSTRPSPGAAFRTDSVHTPLSSPLTSLLTACPSGPTGRPSDHRVLQGRRFIRSPDHALLFGSGVRSHPQIADLCRPLHAPSGVHASGHQARKHFPHTGQLAHQHSVGGLRSLVPRRERYTLLSPRFPHTFFKLSLAVAVLAPNFRLSSSVKH